jgi:hypothetical protein
LKSLPELWLAFSASRDDMIFEQASEKRVDSHLPGSQDPEGTRKPYPVK